MKEFEIELHGKKEKVKLRDPTRGEKRQWQQYLLELQAKAKDVLAKPEHGKEDLALGVELEDKRADMIIALCVAGPLSKPEEFDHVSDPDLVAIYLWLDSCLGVNLTKKQEDFTKS